MNGNARLKAELAGDELATRISAAEALATMGENASFAAVELVKACGDEDEAVWNYAVAALEDLGPPPSETVGLLSNLAADLRPLIAYWAITLLGRLGSKASASREVLAEVLRDSPEISVRQRAVWAIGKMGSPSETAIEALQLAAKSDDPKLARSAQAILQQR